MGIAILRLVAVLPLTLAAGCSTTSYVTAVTTFSDDATKVHTAFGDLIAQERDAAAANAEYLTLDKGYPFTVSASCNAPREPPDPSTPLNFQGIDCNGLYLADGGWKPVVPYAAGPHALDLASKLDAYGKALLGLAQAKDVAEVKDAANKAAATVAALATGACQRL